MKKLVLAFALMISVLASAQEAFVRKYTKIYSSISNIHTNCDITVVYNSVETDADIVLYQTGNKTYKFYRIEKEVEIGYNKDGIKYQLVFCIDQKGNSMGLQIFDDDSTLRLIYPNNGFIEFYN
jgi:hypothetical protein